MAGLVVNADDYGLTRGISRAILRAHRGGIVTATSAITVAPAFAATVGWLDDVPDLSVGLHLAAVGEDPPLLTAAEVPSLVDRTGRFALSSVALVPRLAVGRVDPADLEREFTAQFEAFCATGRRPTHLDTHHNLHLWPMVGRVVTALAQQWSVPALRVPWSRARTPTGVGVRHFARTLRRRADAAAVWHPDAYFGIDESGHLDESALLALLDGLSADPGATVELAVHPGEADDGDLARYPWPGARRDAELAALTSAAVAEAVRRGGHHLVPYGPPSGGRLVDLTEGTPTGPDGDETPTGTRS
ncbi:MAG: ChbG/HpnK family deacetylase [Acidimicrobiales bacterium]|nr:ChbG/HpnK family deacetylase [Acidimicrobiales bacterium]